MSHKQCREDIQRNNRLNGLTYCTDLVLVRSVVFIDCVSLVDYLLLVTCCVNALAMLPRQLVTRVWLLLYFFLFT